MKIIPFKSFNKIYQDSVRNVYKHWTPQMQKEIAVHCHSWGEKQFDFKIYLEASSIRYYYAYCSLAKENDIRTICDIGGFWGVWPLTLKALGYDVTMTETMEFYSDAFSDLFNYIGSKGVTIFNHDPFQPQKKYKSRNDFITAMAVLEHYPHSLKTFMGNMISLLEHSGRLYIEVPNIAYWPKRINLLFGKTPLADLKVIYLSAVPFIGHHHEFTISELNGLADLSGFEIVTKFNYNYSQDGNFIQNILRRPLETLAYLSFPNTRECIAVVCRKKT